MSSKATEALMAQIHEALGAEFLQRIKSGEASPADLNAARQFLKDNNITVANPANNKSLRDLATSVPFEDIETDVPLRFVKEG